MRNNRKLIWLWAFSLFFIAVSVVTTPYLSAAALALFCVSLFMLRSEDVFAMLFGLLPFANIFKLTPTSMSLFTVCEMIAVVFFLLRKRLSARQCGMISTLAIYLLVFSIDRLNILTIVKVIMGFLIIGLAVMTITKDGLKRIARLLSLSTIAMLLLSINEKYLAYVELYFDDLDYYVDATGHATDTLRISGFFGDPNYCAVLIVLALALLCVLYYHKAIGGEFWVYAAVLTPCGFFTYSKSYFLCIALLAVLLVLFVLFPKHKVWAVIAIIGFSIAVYYTAIGKIEVMNLILSRFSKGDLTTGRTNLNQIYLQYIFGKMRVLLFGEGISADRITGIRNNVHCLYIETLFKLGIVGASVYCGTLASVLPKREKKARRGFADYLPVFFFLLMFAFLAGILNYALPFYILIVYLSINYDSLGYSVGREVQQ